MVNGVEFKYLLDIGNKLNIDIGVMNLRHEHLSDLIQHLTGNGLKHPSGPVRSHFACTIPIWSTGGWYFVLKMTFFLSCFRLESRWKLENGL